MADSICCCAVDCASDEQARRQRQGAGARLGRAACAGLLLSAFVFVFVLCLCLSCFVRIADRLQVRHGGNREALLKMNIEQLLSDIARRFASNGGVMKQLVCVRVRVRVCSVFVHISISVSVCADC